MEQSPSWEANRFSGSQEIPRNLWNPKVHYRTHNVRHLFLSWASSIQSITPHPASWRSVLILSSHLRLGEAYLYLKLSVIIYLCIYNEAAVYSLWVSCFKALNHGFVLAVLLAVVLKVDVISLRGFDIHSEHGDSTLFRNVWLYWQKQRNIPEYFNLLTYIRLQLLLFPAPYGRQLHNILHCFM